MGKLVFAGIFTLAASTSLAQTDAPEPDIVQEPAASEQAGAGGPANLCQELLAFMAEPPPEEAAVAAPAQASAEPAGTAQDGSTQRADAPDAQPAEEGAESEEAAAAGEKDTAPASDEAVPPQSSEESTSSQEITGQSGPAAESPEPNAEPAEAGTAENAPQRSSVSAPVPTDPTSTPKDAVLSVAEAEELAEANDIAACQSASRELRLAGVAVPPPLLALTALNLQYHQTAEPLPEAPAAGEPAAGQQDAAPATEPLAPQTQTD
jgi:hypothetical protein